MIEKCRKKCTECQNLCQCSQAISGDFSVDVATCFYFWRQIFSVIAPLVGKVVLAFLLGGDLV